MKPNSVSRKRKKAVQDWTAFTDSDKITLKYRRYLLTVTIIDLNL